MPLLMKGCNDSVRCKITFITGHVTDGIINFHFAQIDPANDRQKIQINNNRNLGPTSSGAPTWILLKQDFMRVAGAGISRRVALDGNTIAPRPRPMTEHKDPLTQS